MRDGRSRLRRPLREVLPERVSRRPANRTPRRRAMRILRILSPPLRMVQGGPRAGAPANPSRGDAAPRALRARRLHSGHKGRGCQQSSPHCEGGWSDPGPRPPPGLPRPRPEQAVPLRFVSEATGPVLLTNLAVSPRGTRTHAPRSRRQPRDVGGARRIDAERFEARVQRLDSGETVAVHPDNAEERPLRPVPKTTTARAVVVWTPEGAYLSALPAKASKD